MFLLHYFSSLGAIFPIIIGLIFFKRLSDVFAKPFLVYLTTVTILEAICLNRSLNFINNHFLYNCIDLISILFFVYINFHNSNKLYRLIPISIFVITSYNIFAFELNTFKQNNYILIYFYIGIFSIIQLFHATKNENTVSFNTFRFWFYTGYIITTFSSLTMFVFFEKIMRLDKTYIIVQYYYFFTFVISFLQYLSFSIAFSCKK